MYKSVYLLSLFFLFIFTSSKKASNSFSFKKERTGGLEALVLGWGLE